MEFGRRGAGGTPGGLVEFFVGLLLVIGGGFLFINQVRVVNRGFRFAFPGGGIVFDNFGLALLPLLFGIGILFFNGRSLLGWFLTFAGAVIIIFGILSNLDIDFLPTSLFNTLIMLGMIAAGVGLVARSLRDRS